MTLQAWKIPLLNSMTFHDVREPCSKAARLHTWLMSAQYTLIRLHTWLMSATVHVNKTAYLADECHGTR